MSCPPGGKRFCVGPDPEVGPDDTALVLVSERITVVPSRVGGARDNPATCIDISKFIDCPPLWGLTVVRATTILRAVTADANRLFRPYAGEQSVIPCGSCPCQAFILGGAM